ncbi:MAG: efflux RND transporter permease subunit [Magnetococcales bacterium]|nr:efflux RND transporter permease subunit [Magnetococcales bacterium]
MSLIQVAIHRPVAVVVGVLLVSLFGLLAYFQIPVQLIPDVRKPIITVTTNWPGSSPLEVESEITIPQEDVLKAVPGLVKISSSSTSRRSQIKLEFRPGTDMDATLMLTNNRLQQVKDYPSEAQRPTLKSADSDDAPITWIKLSRSNPNDSRPVSTELDYVEDTVKATLERIPGVATINVYGGRNRELRITVDPDQLALRGISVSQIGEVLRRENANISAGNLDEGKRAYLVRSLGNFQTPEQVKAVVIRSDEAGIITMGEISDVAFNHSEARVNVRANGRPILAINAVRENGANVLDIMTDIQSSIAHLNRDILPSRGLELTMVYDQTDYIHAAITLVRNNLLIGALLAMAALLLFLRSLSATFIIALAIPISVVGAFLAMYALGRTVNVISLAGLAFAVGMVVDPAIVVLENIVRLRGMGLSREEAAVQGASQVWGAIFIATATTVAVFLPILGLEIEAAQLFGDIAVALCAAVLFSLVVSTTVIPTLGHLLIGRFGRSYQKKEKKPSGRLANGLAALVAAINRRLSTRLLVVGGLAGAALGSILILIPPAEYLPSGSRNLIFAMLIPPPGYNLEEMTRMAEGVEKELKPYWDPAPETVHDIPAMRNLFFVTMGPRVFMGSATRDPKRVRELLPIMKKPIRSIPGTIGIVNQSSIFGRGIGGGRSLDIAITGPNLHTLTELARKLFIMAKEAIPDAQVRPIPGLELGNPELQLTPNRLAIRENSLSAFEVGQAVDAFNGGLKVDDIIIDGQEIDLTLRAPVGLLSHTQDIGNLPIPTPNGHIIPVASVMDIQLTTGPVQVDHLDRERTVTLRITPPHTMALETAVNLISEKMITPIRQEGLPEATLIRLTEGADQLLLAKEAMIWQFSLAMLITYLLMAALFESFLYPVVIIATVPLAAAGGLLGLKLLNVFHFQAMDVLTMLGFVILVGVVVNNAILIVHQALGYMEEQNMTPNQAVAASVKIRVRPIFMSTITSVLGLLPLVLFPGAGSELYRGLGSVVIGGLLISTLFTLVMVPALFSLALSAKQRLFGPTASSSSPSRG